MTHERILILAFAFTTALLGLALAREVFRRRERGADETLLFPFDPATFSQEALERSIRIAKASSATLLPAYLAVVPLRVSLDAPLRRHADRAIELLERIEIEASRRGVPVDGSIESGRTRRHALSRLVELRKPDQAIIAAAANGRQGFSPDDIAWFLDRVECGVVVLKPPG